MPKSSRTKTTRASKPTKRKGEVSVREAAEVEREVTRGEPERGGERGRDVERDAPVHRSSEHGPEHHQE